MNPVTRGVPDFFFDLRLESASDCRAIYYPIGLPVPIPTSLLTHVDASGRMTRLAVKLSKKLALAAALLEEIETGRDYTEAEINKIFYRFVDDFALIRRILVDQGDLARDRDCSRYWRIDTSAEL